MQTGYGTQIEEFPFLNRSKELTSIERFIEDPSACGLWLYGEPNVGKTRLMKQALDAIGADGKVYVVYVEVCHENDDQAALESLLEQLQGISRSSFSAFLKHAASLEVSVAPSTALATVPLAMGLDSPIVCLAAGLMSAVSMAACFEVGGKRKSTYQLVSELLHDLTTKSKRSILIAIDGFGYLKERTRGLFQHVMSNGAQSCAVKFIFSSQIGDVQPKRDCINQVISFMQIKPFVDQTHFRQALASAFPLNYISDAQIEEIFAICGGNIGMLFDYVASYLLECQPHDRVFADFVEHLKCRIREKGEEALVRPTLLQALLIQTLLCLQSGVTGDFLIKAASEYLHHSVKLDAAVFGEWAPENSLDTALNECRARHWIGKSGETYYVRPYYQIVFKHLDLSGKKDLYQSCYRFFTAVEESQWRRAFPYREREDVLLKLLYLLDRDDWCERGRSYMLRLIQEGRLEDAGCYIAHFRDGELLDYLSAEDLLTMAEACYALGRYDDVNGLFGESQQDLFIHEESHLYRKMMLLGKVANIQKDLERAASYLHEALAHASTKDEKIAALSMRQLVLIENPETGDEARRIFDQILQMLRDETKWSESACMSARTVVDFKLSYKAIDRILLKAYDDGSEFFAKNPMLEPSLELAFGLQALRKGKNDHAFDHFKTAQTALSTARPHEQAYAYNDMGVSRMIQKRYEEALEWLNEGLAWASTPYILKALLANKLTCLSLLRKPAAVRHQLEKVQENFSLDDEVPLVVNRTCMAICHALLLMPHRQEQDEALFKRSLENASKCATNSQQKRRLKVYERCWVKKEALPSPDRLTHRDVLFQPWIATLHHD